MVVNKTKKTIGISFSRTNFQNYWNWFTEETQDGMLELVELSFEKNNIEDFSRCDGFVEDPGAMKIWSLNFNPSATSLKKKYSFMR